MYISLFIYNPPSPDYWCFEGGLCEFPQKIGACGDLSHFVLVFENMPKKSAPAADLKHIIYIVYKRDTINKTKITNILLWIHAEKVIFTLNWNFQSDNVFILL